MANQPIQPLNNNLITHHYSSQKPQPDLSDQEDIMMRVRDYGGAVQQKWSEMRSKTEGETQHVIKFKFSKWSDIQTPRRVQGACASNSGFYDKGKYKWSKKSRLSCGVCQREPQYH